MRSKVAPAPDPELQFVNLNTRWRALRRHGFSIREVACVGVPRTLLLAEVGLAGQPCVSLSAGVHGDEPAGPWALLSLAEGGLLDPRFSYRIWTCTNPGGFTAGTRENPDGDDVNRSFGAGGKTPEAKAVIRANRDRRFVLSLDLHEDPEAAGFYCYEPPQALALAPAILQALDDCGLPVATLTADFDLGYPPGAPFAQLSRGLVVADVALEQRTLAGLPYSLFIARKAARHAMTLEAPGTRALANRIATLRVAVCAAIAQLVKVSAQTGAK